MRGGGGVLGLDPTPLPCTDSQGRNSAEGRTPTNCRMLGSAPQYQTALNSRATEPYFAHINKCMLFFATVCN